MKARLSPRAFGVFILLVVVALSAGAATEVLKTSGGPPTVTVTSVQLNPAGVTCGTEMDCVRVNWAATVPAGTTVSGWSIELKVTRSNGTSDTTTKTAVASARQLDIAEIHSVDLTSYDVKVKANYSSSVTVDKAGSF